MRKCQDRITALKAEIEEMEKRELTLLSKALADKDEAVKDGLYKALLRISLLADVVNEAAETCRELLNKYGLADFEFRKHVVDMCALSQKIASIPLLSKSRILEDFLVDDDEFVKGCMELADKHLNERLNL